MITVTASHVSNPSGRSQILAKAAGRQRTINYDHSRSMDANYGAAVGRLLDVLLDERGRAKMRHPSAQSRITVTQPNPNRSMFRFQIDV